MADILCVPDDLAERITCLAEQNRQTLLAEVVVLLCSIANVECDPDTLAENSACLDKWNEVSLLASAVYILCQIANSPSAATCIKCSDADPVDGVDIPPCDCSIWITSKDGVPNLWKSSDGATWQAIIWSAL